MDYVKKLFKIAKIIDLKLKYAQDLADQDAVPLNYTSAQAGDIQSALGQGSPPTNFYSKAVENEIGQLLNTAKVSETAKVTILINVDSQLNCSYSVLLDPVTPANKTSAGALSKLLHQKYSSQMKKTLSEKGISVSDIVTANWFNF